MSTSSTASSPATAVPSPSDAHTPQQVGMSFVAKYYTTLTRDPESLYKCYKETSTFSFGAADSNNTETLTGLKNISNKISNLGFRDSKVKLQVVDAQRSLNGSILVVVNGSIGVQGGPYKRFTQCFVLAEQQNPKGYYVLNDVFRYHRDEASGAAGSFSHSMTASPSTTTSQQAKQVTLASTATNTRDRSEISQASSTVSSRNPKSISTTSSVDGNLSDGDAERSEVDSTVATVATASALDEVNLSDAEDGMRNHKAPQSSTSSVTRTMERTRSSDDLHTEDESDSGTKKQTTQSEKPQKGKQLAKDAVKKSDGPKTYASAVGGEDYVPAPQPATQAPPSQERKNATDRPNKAFRQSRSGRTTHAVYVSKLNEQTTIKDLQDTFQQFGAVVDINNRSRDGFAFVHFDNADSVEKALQQTGALSIRGSAVSIDRRRPSSYQNKDQANASSAPSGRGRGGFSRRGGRGGFSSRGGFKGGNQAATNDTTTSTTLPSGSGPSTANPSSGRSYRKKGPKHHQQQSQDE